MLLTTIVSSVVDPQAKPFDDALVLVVKLSELVKGALVPRPRALVVGAAVGVAVGASVSVKIVVGATVKVDLSSGPEAAGGPVDPSGATVDVLPRGLVKPVSTGDGVVVEEREPPPPSGASPSGAVVDVTPRGVFRPASTGEGVAGYSTAVGGTMKPVGLAVIGRSG